MKSEAKPIERRDRTEVFLEYTKSICPVCKYLVQSLRYPAPISSATIRKRLAALSREAGARKADGSPLRLRPHDCRRIFASEHLNNNTPIHVIQALLGHATLDTVMVYAKEWCIRCPGGRRTTARFSQARRPALAGIIGAMRAWTALMISALSIPWR